jgi:hypothetical protein
MGCYCVLGSAAVDVVDRRSDVKEQSSKIEEAKGTMGSLLHQNGISSPGPRDFSSRKIIHFNLSCSHVSHRLLLGFRLE